MHVRAFSPLPKPYPRSHYLTNPDQCDPVCSRPKIEPDCPLSRSAPYGRSDPFEMLPRQQLPDREGVITYTQGTFPSEFEFINCQILTQPEYE